MVHEKVEENNVLHDRTEKGEAEGHISADDKKKTARDLKDGDALHITGFGHRTDKLAGPASHGRNWLEVEKGVRTENNKNESEKNADNDGDDFHARKRARSARKIQSGNAMETGWEAGSFPYRKTGKSSY